MTPQEIAQLTAPPTPAPTTTQPTQSAQPTSQVTQPTTQPAQPAQSSGLDPQTVALSQAIRQVESGNNPTQVGKSGEYGAYQWEPKTWDKMSALAGVNVPLQQASLQDQNKVAYTQIKQWKDEGYNVGQIASMWNAGEGAPNAYLTGNKGTNIEGVSYDTQKYAQQVAQTYQQLKSQGQTTSAQPQSLGQTITGAAKGLFNFAFPIVGDIGADVQGKSNKNLLQQAADAGLSALWFAPGLDALAPETAAALEGVGTIAKLGGGALYGAGIGATAGGLGAISQGGGLGDVAKGAGIGALGGGVLGGAGAGIGQFLGGLPSRVAQGALKLDPETAQYALDTKGIGTVSSLTRKSKAELYNLSGQIDDTLSSDAYKASTGNGAQALENAAKSFTNAKYTANDVFANAEKMIPGQAKLLDKLQEGTATLSEKNTIRQALDVATKTVYTRLSRPPESKALAKALADELRTEIQTTAKETIPLFSKLSKEKNLQEGLKKLERKTPRNIIGLRDLWAMAGGGGLGLLAGGALPGAALGYGLERLGSTPGGQFATAKTIQALTPIAQKVGSAGLTGGTRLLGQGQ